MSTTEQFVKWFCGFDFLIVAVSPGVIVWPSALLHTQNPEPDESRTLRTMTHTKSISWPNYHSGRNGDYQKIKSTEPLHELLRSASSPSGTIEYFPAHPHEGAVGTPAGENGARVVATGLSKVTGRHSIFWSHSISRWIPMGTGLGELLRNPVFIISWTTTGHL